MRLIQLLPFLTLAAALPHKQEKKSRSINFVQRSVPRNAVSPNSRLAKRQSSGGDVSDLLNDNNVR